MKKKCKKNIYLDGGNLNIINGYYKIPIDQESDKTSDKLILNTDLPNFQEINTNQNINTANPVYGIDSKQTNNTFNLSDMGNQLGGIASGVQGMIKGFTNNSSINDTQNYYTKANQLKNFDGNATTNDQLMINSKMLRPLSDPNWKTVRGTSAGQQVMGTVNSTFSGAKAGASVGGGIGAIVGAAIGLGSGLAGTFVGRKKAREEANKIAKANQLAYKQALNTFDKNVDNVNKQTLMNMNMNYSANGGPLDIMFGTPNFNQNSASINTSGNNTLNHYQGFTPLTTFAYGGDITSIDAGGSHEQNPLGGVPMGIAQDGTPNVVEQGELIKDDYVFSDRLKVSDDILNKYSKIKKGDTYAKALEKLSKESEERPNDPISKNGIDTITHDLMQSQEELKQKKQLLVMNKQKNKFGIGGLMEMYAPATASFGDAIISQFEKPNHTYMNTVEDYMFGIPNVAISPTGNYIKKTPLDVNFYTNKLDANAGATRRNIANMSGANRATQMANLLASDYNYGIQLGNLSRQALEQNIANDMAVTDFNNKVNQFNTQQNFAVQQANLQKALQVGQSLYNTQTAKNLERLRVKDNKEKAIDNFTANISEISKELEDRRFRNALAKSGVYGIQNEYMSDVLSNYPWLFTKNNKSKKK